MKIIRWKKGLSLAIILFSVSAIGYAGEQNKYDGKWTFVRLTDEGPCSKERVFNLYAKNRKIWGEVETNVGRFKLSGKIVPDGETSIRLSGSRPYKLVGNFQESVASGTWVSTRSSGTFSATKK